MQQEIVSKVSAILNLYLDNYLSQSRALWYINRLDEPKAKEIVQLYTVKLTNADRNRVYKYIVENL